MSVRGPYRRFGLYAHAWNGRAVRRRGSATWLTTLGLGRVSARCGLYLGLLATIWSGTFFSAAFLRLSLAQIFPQRGASTRCVPRDLLVAACRSIAGVVALRHIVEMTGKAAGCQGLPKGHRLHAMMPCGITRRRFERARLRLRGRRSSGVEHTLGKGGVECSIHSGGTSFRDAFSGIRPVPAGGPAFRVAPRMTSRAAR